MMNQLIYILVIEPSALLTEGLAAVLKKAGLNCKLYFAESVEQAEMLVANKKYNLIIINPSFFNNQPKIFNTTKNRFDAVKWVGLVYGWHDPKFLSAFDALITVTDSEEAVSGTICKLVSGNNEPGQVPPQEKLTERETDVLKLLATGLASKEIADKLNISVNTVITHRKNISQKTGIKTVSGLTIYAVVQNLINIDNLSE